MQSRCALGRFQSGGGDSCAGVQGSKCPSRVMLVLPQPSTAGDKSVCASIQRASGTPLSSASTIKRVDTVFENSSPAAPGVPLGASMGKKCGTYVSEFEGIELTHTPLATVLAAQKKL